jgi:predicted RNase H-like nuclease (RuvC/YqgF family)
MNEFDLQGWEREIQAWRRRLDSQGEAAPQTSVVRAELNDIQRDIGELRSHPESEAQARDRVERRLVHLLALYDLACRGRVGKA